METLRRRETSAAAMTLHGLRVEPDGDADIPTVTIASGPYLQQVPLAPGGTTVGELRRRFGSRLDIDPAAVAVVGGQETTDATRVGPDATVMFFHRAGEKGAG